MTDDRSGHEALDRYSRADQTRRAVVNNQVRDLLVKYRDADGENAKKAAIKDAIEVFRGLPPDEGKRAAKRYGLGVRHTGVPYEFIDLYYEQSAAVKARYFKEMYDKASPGRRKELLKYAQEINLFTPSVIRELKNGLAKK